MGLFAFRDVLLITLATQLVASTACIVEEQPVEDRSYFGERYPWCRNWNEYAIALRNTIESDYWQFIAEGVNHRKPYFVDDMAFFSKAHADEIALTENPYWRWSSARVPVKFASVFSDSEIETMWSGLRTIEAATCIRFVPVTEDISGYVLIDHKNSGCWSYVGHVGGAQTLNLGPGCDLYSTTIHQMVHALGYHHEQSRRDRDDHVRILFENMDEHYHQNFAKQNTINSVPYDLGSIMNYGTTYFSNNNLPTMEILQGLSVTRGSDLSPLDIKRINIDYCGADGTVSSSDL